MVRHRKHVDSEGQPDTRPASGPHLVLISEVRPRLPAGSALPKQLVHAARPGLQIAKVQHELLEPCSSHRDLMAVPSNDHDRLGCLYLSSARQYPLSVQPMLANLVNKVVGRQCHGEDENIRDEASTLRWLERRDAFSIHCCSANWISWTVPSLLRVIGPGDSLRRSASM